MNIYYDPETFGLAIVGEVEFSSGAFEFDTSVVWRDTMTGDLFVADDSGCSCPVPFDNSGRADLTKIKRLQDLLDYFDQRRKDSYHYDPECDSTAVAKIDSAIGELIQKVRAA